MKIKKQGNTTWIQCIQWVHTRPVGWDTIVRKQMENKKTKIEIQKIYDEWSEGTEGRSIMNSRTSNGSLLDQAKLRWKRGVLRSI